MQKRKKQRARKRPYKRRPRKKSRNVPRKPPADTPATRPLKKPTVPTKPLPTRAEQLAALAAAFISEHAGLPFRSFWRKWVNHPQVRFHLCTMSLLPDADGIRLMRGLINKTQPTPQSQNIGKEDQPPIQVFLAPGLNLGYGAVDVQALRRPVTLPATTLPAAGGNGDASKP